MSHPLADLETYLRGEADSYTECVAAGGASDPEYMIATAKKFTHWADLVASVEVRLILPTGSKPDDH